MGRRDPYLLPTIDVMPDWMDEAACKDEATPAFFPPQHRPRALAAPLAVCRTCPVVDECLQFALRHGCHGVWGATSERQRRRMNARDAA